MGIVVVTGAMMMCPFGTAPSTLIATSQTTCLGCSKPVATIMDFAMGSNIPPFGMCTSMANPRVAAATAAAKVLTPQPCAIAPAGTWIPGKPTVLVGGKPVLTNDSSLFCSMGAGKVTITNPGQTTIMV